MRTLLWCATFCIASILGCLAHGQQAPQPQEEKKAPTVQMPADRLASAKNVLVVRSHGGDIPFDTIRMTIEGWGRFTLVNTLEKADLIIEVASIGGVERRAASGVNPAAQTALEPFSSPGKELSTIEVRMTVADAHNKRVLWHGTESAKSAVRKKARENNLVEASEKLASRFHDHLEPPLVR